MKLKFSNMILKQKQQSMQWKTAESPRPKKAHMSKQKIKVMLIVFFDQKDMVHHELVPEGETVNQPAILPAGSHLPP